MILNLIVLAMAMQQEAQGGFIPRPKEKPSHRGRNIALAGAAGTALVGGVGVALAPTLTGKDHSSPNSGNVLTQSTPLPSTEAYKANITQRQQDKTQTPVETQKELQKGWESFTSQKQLLPITVQVPPGYRNYGDSSPDSERFKKNIVKNGQVQEEQNLLLIRSIAVASHIADPKNFQVFIDDEIKRMNAEADNAFNTTAKITTKKRSDVQVVVKTTTVAGQKAWAISYEGLPVPSYTYDKDPHDLNRTEVFFLDGRGRVTNISYIIASDTASEEKDNLDTFLKNYKSLVK